MVVLKTTTQQRLSRPESVERTLSINDIKRFIEEPARLYFNWHLDTYFGSDSEDLDDSEASLWITCKADAYYAFHRMW